MLPYKLYKHLCLHSLYYHSFVNLYVCTWLSAVSTGRAEPCPFLHWIPNYWIVISTKQAISICDEFYSLSKQGGMHAVMWLICQSTIITRLNSGNHANVFYPQVEISSHHSFYENTFKKRWLTALTKYTWISW